MKHALISLVAALCAAQATASDFYVGGAGGKSKYTMDSYSTTMTQTRDDAYKVFGGLEFAPQVAVELGYAVLGNSEGDFEGVPMRFRTDTLYVAVVGHFPVSPAVSLTGKLGTAASTTRVDANVFGDIYSDQSESSSPMIGIGFRLDLNSNVSLVADYEYFGRVAESDEGEELRAGMASVGLRIAF